jgi:formylmethanofuran dehydrogenase subunit C
MILLTPIKQFRVPVDAVCITPNIFSGKSKDEIVALQVWEGNRQTPLGNLFKIEVETAPEPEKEVIIKISGDLKKVRRIGSGMSMGKILIEGNVGNHLGEGMKGGVIVVEGSAGLWTGSMMLDGVIEVKGDVGEYTGGAYRGSVKGMKGGIIIVHGNAGNELGCFMRGGLIKVDGNVGQFVGMHMRKGTIFVKGDSAGRVGAEMVKGKIVVSGNVPSILPTFTVDGLSKKTKVEGEDVVGPFYTFVGDVAEGGEGRIFISQIKNPYLKDYEKFLG